MITRHWLEKSDQVMYDLLDIKYKQSPHFQAKLLASGTKKLIESTQNKYWGCVCLLDQVLLVVFSWYSVVGYLHIKNGLNHQCSPARLTMKLSWRAIMLPTCRHRSSQEYERDLQMPLPITRSRKGDMGNQT